MARMLSRSTVKSESENGSTAEPLEIALCRECGQHYYVGRERDGKLREAGPRSQPARLRRGLLLACGGRGRTAVQALWRALEVYTKLRLWSGGSREEVRNPTKITPIN